MAANVLQSPKAVTMSVHVVRAFVRLRQLVADQRALAAKLDEIEAKIGAHDEQLAALVEAIRQLTTPAGWDHNRKIGYHQGNR
jgi:hypothetical protein